MKPVSVKDRMSIAATLLGGGIASIVVFTITDVWFPKDAVPTWLSIPLSLLLVGGAIGFLMFTGALNDWSRATAARKALSDLNVICEGALYLGKNSESVAVQFFKNYSEQLCKTKNGAWFLLTQNGGDPRAAVRPLDEQAAKRWLESDPKLYEETFGAPPAA